MRDAACDDDAIADPPQALDTSRGSSSSGTSASAPSV
jgi:hypothetical protein